MEPKRKLWTREECLALQAAGIWQDQRLELVEGELINKMGKRPPHIVALTKLRNLLIRAFGEDFVLTETPIDVAPQDNPTSEPEPDVVVLSRPVEEFRAGNAKPAELRLVAEVSDSSVGFDLTKKAALYARAGIVEYWVVDIAARRLVVHRNPEGDLYRDIKVYAEHEKVSPLAAPNQEFTVGEAF
jgi:Uma2 family endonuclease